MHIDGACHCGAITYEAEIDPDGVIICHCTDCQINSASAFRYGVMVPAADFRLMSGTPKRYLKTAESGNRRALAFCGDCGTSLYGSDATDAPPVLSLRLGTARQRAQLKPRRAIWHRSALPWLGEIDAMQEFDTQPGAVGRPPPVGSFTERRRGKKGPDRAPMPRSTELDRQLADGLCGVLVALERDPEHAAF